MSDCQAIAIIKAGHGFRTKFDPNALPKSTIHGNDTCDYVDAARQVIACSSRLLTRSSRLLSCSSRLLACSLSDCVDAARQAILATTDYNCGQAYRGFLEDTIADGTVAEAVLDKSLERMYGLMFRLGIFDPDTPYKAYSQIGPRDIDT